MRLIFEENIERMDFLEIILSPKEYEKISLKGFAQEFKGGMEGKRNLNVYVRVDTNYEEKEELDAISKRQESQHEERILGECTTRSSRRKEKKPSRRHRV